MRYTKIILLYTCIYAASPLQFQRASPPTTIGQLRRLLFIARKLHSLRLIPIFILNVRLVFLLTIYILLSQVSQAHTPSERDTHYKAANESANK